MQYVDFLDAVSLAPEHAPVEGSPMPVLQINQNGQDEKYNDAGQNAFLIHERGKTPRRGPSNAQRETAVPR
jgi:hypothetical protein